MFRRTLPIPFLVLALVVLTLAAAQTVLADTELGDAGNVGMHSLTDTHATPGARCGYKLNSDLGLGKLKTITAHPPNMRAAPGRSHQVIGWRFTIQRNFVGEHNRPWKVVYSSSLQTTAIGGEGGGFSSMSASILVPPNEGATGVHHYRVVVKMFWFGKDDQTVVGTSRHRVDFYRGVMNTGERWTDDGSCGGLSPS